MKKFLDVLAVLALGAAVMAWLDPTPRTASRRSRHPRARLHWEAVPAVEAEDPQASEADERLRERLRARLRRIAGAARAVDVDVRQGEVRLRGRVPATELDRLTSVVWATPGVEGIENRLAVER